jgi:hypothetical protein
MKTSVEKNMMALLKIPADRVPHIIERIMMFTL